MINILKKFLVFSIFLSMMSVPSYADIIGVPHVEPQADDVCAYYKDTNCYWLIDPGMCVGFPGEDIVCEHALPCGQPHVSKKCNPAATTKAECTLIDSNVTCRRVPKPAPKTRWCSCKCKNAAGEILDKDWNPIFTQIEPFTQSCQEKYVEMSNSVFDPPVTPPLEEVTCKGWTSEVEDQVDADYEEWYEEWKDNGYPPGETFPFPPKQDGTMQCEVTDPPDPLPPM